MIALALLLATLAPDDGIADQIAHCGVARSQIESRYEPDLQDETATIATPGPALTESQLKCLVGLTLSGRILAFIDPAAQARFDPLFQVAARKAASQEARQWLAEHGLLDKLPVYDPARQTIAEYGASLESLCGVTPGTRLKASGANRLVFVPPANLDFDDAGSTAFQCIISAAFVADPEEKRFTLGIIGNEATR